MCMTLPKPPAFSILLPPSRWGNHYPSPTSLCSVFFSSLSYVNPLTLIWANNLAPTAQRSKKLSSRNFPKSWCPRQTTTWVLAILVAFPPGRKKTDHKDPLVLDKPDQGPGLPTSWVSLRCWWWPFLPAPRSLSFISPFHLDLKYLSISLP